MEAESYMKKRRKLSGLFFETALPNEYLVVIGQKGLKPILGGRKFRWFKKFLRVPASVQRLYFKTDNANFDYQGIGIEGYANWRINSNNPSQAIAVLDLFDENDPMALTNEALRTICIEAVRHVIANMSIEDAIRKKDDIAENLQNQLKTIEEKWGIVFDQVGIEKVTIMSGKVFNDLQAQYRSQLHLNSEKTRLNTELEITQVQNATSERTTHEKLESQQRIDLLRIENNAKIKERELNERQIFADKERTVGEENFRKEMIFKLEQEETKHNLEKLTQELQLAMHELEMKIAESNLKFETINSQLAEKKIALQKLQREVEQSYTNDELFSRFVAQLPAIAQSVNISNYSVLDTGGNSNLTPIIKMVNELVFSFKNMAKSFRGEEVI